MIHDIEDASFTPEKLKGDIADAPRNIRTYVFYDGDEVSRGSSSQPLPAEGTVEEPRLGEEKYGKYFKQTKEEATSMRHLLTHLPKNIYCPTCQSAKMQRKQARRKKDTLGPVPQKFGQEGTCDHFIAHDSLSHGVDGEHYGIVYRDRATNWMDCRGVTAKDAERAKNVITSLRGADDKFEYFYSDGSPELRKCFQLMGIPHDHSTPGNPEHNARADRTVKMVLEGARSILLEAGLPQAFWPYAVTYFCLCMNTDDWKGSGASAWMGRFGEPFMNTLIPFGALVAYMPREVNKRPRAKMGPKGHTGVFLGYVPRVGGELGDDV